MRPVYVSREHVLDIVHRAGLSPEVEQRVLALPDPVELDKVVEACAAMGITKDWLISRMGGSP